MAHRSRLGSIVIDCHTDHVEHAAGFWSEALGHPSEVHDDGQHATILADNGGVVMLIQAVNDRPRVHFEIETDDLPAEVRRLTTIGARKIGVVDHGVVMEAPTGHHFRVTGPKSHNLAEFGTVWDES